MGAAFRKISKEELREKIDGKEPVQVVNVLSPESYSLGFIPGSLKIPVADLDRRAGELDQSKEVITYCAQYECPASGQAAEKLAAKGFRVRAYEGGIKEWKETGWPVEGAGSLSSEYGAKQPSESPDQPSGLSGMPDSSSAGSRY